MARLNNEVNNDHIFIPCAYKSPNISPLLVQYKIDPLKLNKRVEKTKHTTSNDTL